MPKEQEEVESEAPAEAPAEAADPFPEIRAKCEEHHCQKYRQVLDACNERVRSRSKTAETCHEEVIDLMHCVDHCATPLLFKKLK